MFTFFHCYLPETWEMHERAGLWSDNDGIRFCQSPTNPPEKKFNQLAKTSGELYKILVERKCPFYIDRLQGGSYIDDYVYDAELLREYENILNENFWGLQMHEWVHNYYTDIFIKLAELPKEKWTKENIEKTILKKYPGSFLFLETMTAEEMEYYGKPHTAEKFFYNLSEIYKKRSKIAQLIPCDSAFLAYNFELSAGNSSRVMPEIGAQTHDARVQICYARGMTRKKGKSFGVYYEPWGGEPFSACCYQKDGKNEWGLSKETGFPYVTAGPNGGSSRSLQKRIFLYGYLCGAEFISEEWGECNLFTDWKDFELSPYGIIKKNFIDFVKKYKDIGDKLTPLAAVLPKDLMVLDSLCFDDYSYCGFKTENPAFINARKGLREIFHKCLPMLPTEPVYRECRTMKNSDIPDAIDILNYDEKMLDKYEYLIDLTGDASLDAKFKNICEIKDIKAVLRTILPCYVDGNAHWLINKCKSGGYYLTVFNHSGIDISVLKGEIALPEARTSVKIMFKDGAMPTVCENEGDFVKINDEYILTLPAGGFAFIRF